MSTVEQPKTDDEGLGVWLDDCACWQQLATAAGLTINDAADDGRRRQLSRGRLKPRAIAPCGGQVLYRQVERLAEAGDRAEGGGREPTGLDLAQRLRRHAGRVRHVTEIAVCSRFTQQPPETPAGLDLFGRERIANHGTRVRLVF
jgi:hypothetical protein